MVIEFVGDVLMVSGLMIEVYVDEMIWMIDEYGFYVVIVLGFVFVYVWFSFVVLCDGFVVVILVMFVVFGNFYNDFVWVVFGFVVVVVVNYLLFVVEIVNVFNDLDVIDWLVEVGLVDEVCVILGVVV